MGNDFTAEQVENAQNVEDIISIVQEEIAALKVSTVMSLYAYVVWKAEKQLLFSVSAGHIFAPRLRRFCCGRRSGRRC